MKVAAFLLVTAVVGVQEIGVVQAFVLVNGLASSSSHHRSNSLPTSLSLSSTAPVHDDHSANTVLSNPPSSNKSSSQPASEYDVVIIGSGIGGLSCAAMCARYGYSVCVLESHSTPGGAAHGFTIRTPKSGDEYQFDTGPSFFSGLNADFPAKASNPLRTVLDAVDERVECVPYQTFGLKVPEGGDLIHTAGFGKMGGTLEQVAGKDALNQWQGLMKRMEPLAAAVDALPTAALRGDIGALLTAGPFLPNFAGLNPLDNLQLTKPFARILDQAGLVKNTFARNWLDLLCFCLSGLPADGTITAEMAMMMGEFYDDDAVMDCPVGGAKSIAEALVRGLEKYGGSIYYSSHVERIQLDKSGKKAIGVQLRKGNRLVRAKKAVVSNLSVWDLYGSDILEKSVLPTSFVQKRLETPVGKSFMHLHVGFRMSREELATLQAHYVCIQDWERGVAAEDNAALLSIPSVHDDSLAPDGHGVLHIYTPATEDFGRWKELDRKSQEYQALKEERSQFLWKMLEQVIPDIRERATCFRVGTPLTHKRFLRRHMGSYGPAIRADEGSFPFPGTPIKGLLVCGDSVFPGIGVPAVSGSGVLAANSVSLDSLPAHIQFLRSLKTSA
eukprot:scaffold17996_cov194-Amphora_coffeaeformis.AAC.14